MKKTMTLAIAAFMMAACTNETEVLDNVSKYITVDANVKSESRVAAKDAFASGDAIKVYAWTGSSTALPSTYVVSSTNTYNGTTWTATPQMLWQDGTTAHHFVGIYPMREITDTDYSLEEDGDLMFAVTTDVVPSADPVSLEFEHLMAKLRVNLNFRNQWDTTPTVTSVKAMAQTAATIAWYPAATVTATGDTEAQALTATTANTTYETLMVPQECKKVSIVIDGKTYSYNGSITLTSGKVSTLNLNIGRDELILEGITVKPWTDGMTVNGGETTEE